MAKSWTSQQLDAMNTKDRDILVSAAAGSGKQQVLVERIVNKITKENGNRYRQTCCCYIYKGSGSRDEGKSKKQAG